MAVFVSSRLFFMGFGALAAAWLPWSSLGVDTPPGLLGYWGRWDGGWYVGIATNGYTTEDPQLAVFFPLFPLLVRAGITLGVGPVLWGILVSLVATFFALYFLYGLTEKLLGERAAKATILAFAFFPTAFFLNAVYTEALFVALASGSLWAAHVRRNLLLAGILGALAAATRNTGVLLLVPLAYEWVINRQEFGWRGAFEVSLVPAGLLGYAAFLWARFRDPLIFASAQEFYWGRVLNDPLETLWIAWIEAREGAGYLLDPAALFLDPSYNPGFQVSDTVNLAFLAFALALLIAGFYFLPEGLWSYAFFATLVPILTPKLEPGRLTDELPLMSLPRFMLAAFPLFLILGYLLSRSGRPALVLWLVASGGLGLAFTAMFVTARWVA